MPAEFVVLGARGQLAQAFLSRLSRRAVGLDRSQLDLADADVLARRLHLLRPRVVLNCAAFNDVDGAESRHESALAANARAPAQLASLALRRGFRLVHFSTDYVFGGDGLSRPRRESDPPAPVNFYGYSKMLGEQVVLTTAPAALVLRVAHLFGGRSLSPGRVHLAQRFLERMQQGRPIAVTRGQFLNPTPVSGVVTATLALLDRRQRGLFHLSGEGECEAADFVRALARLAGLRPRLVWVARDLRPAPRPRYTVLAHLRLAAAGLPPMPHWRISLAEWVATASLRLNQS